jgi:hypothetical protein
VAPPTSQQDICEGDLHFITKVCWIYVGVGPPRPSTNPEITRVGVILVEDGGPPSPTSLNLTWCYALNRVSVTNFK